MYKARRFLVVILIASATLPACSTKRGLGRGGQDADPHVSQDTGQPVQPATGCTFAPSSVDMSCNDDPSLPKPAGGCEPDGTCWCAQGFVLNPVTGRCKLDTTVDGGAVICTVGADQTCNDDPWASLYEGTCVGGVACACKTGYLRNPDTGRCKRAPVTDAGTTPAGEVCTFLLDKTCNDDDSFSGLAGYCGKGGSCGCNPGFVINPATGRCRAGAKPDAASAPDSLASSKCYWNDPAASFKHFRFLLTTPDGKAQTPPRTLDAGMWPMNDLTGQVVEKTGNQFTVDTCVSPLDCQPSLYRFVLCASGSGCSVQSSPGDIDLPIPVGRMVRVVWHLDNARIMSDTGLYWLAIYDAEEGASHGVLLFLGSGGRQPVLTGARNYFDDLPFLVATERLRCGGGSRDGGFQSDDYQMVFSPKTGTGTTLKLATGENGSFEFAEDRGVPQRFQVHCLDAVQLDRADDYWNWDFWMTGEIVTGTPVPVDAGRKYGVCTPGVGMSCNESPMYSWIAGTCQSDGTCICASGFVLNPYGLCALAPRDASPDLASDAKFGCTPGMDQTCNDTPASALWGTCMANGRCVCKSGFAMNPNTGRCAWPPDWDAGPGR